MGGEEGEKEGGELEGEGGAMMRDVFVYVWTRAGSLRK